jgi:hypothetical protein
MMPCSNKTQLLRSEFHYCNSHNTRHVVVAVVADIVFLLKKLKLEEGARYNVVYCRLIQWPCVGSQQETDSSSSLHALQYIGRWFQSMLAPPTFLSSTSATVQRTVKHILCVSHVVAVHRCCPRSDLSDECRAPLMMSRPEHQIKTPPASADTYVEYHIPQHLLLLRTDSEGMCALVHSSRIGHEKPADR